MPTRPPQFTAVGIGASAGGIEALEGFFRGLPPRPGIALIIVTHLSPDRESLLPEVLARFTPLQVVTAQDGMEIRPDVVHVMPANVVLGVAAGRLVLRPLAGRSERKPIDILFSELAAAFGERAGGIVLSGCDGDGTLGLKAIKEHGGLTLAQASDGDGPEYPDMPASAISGGFVDLALPVQEMGAKLLEIVRSDQLLQDMLERDGPAGASDRLLRAALPRIDAILLAQVGHDFSGYKKSTFVRRLQRRMHITRTDSVDGYVQRLASDPEEVGLLFRDLLINVTNFFRDREAFDSLSTFVIPQLFQGRGANDAIRIWVPGCATGEEVYSIGILIREHMAGLESPPRVQLFATDIDDRALAVARAGRYPEALLADVSPERRQRFFVRDGASYCVTKDVRDLCVFSPHSVIRDPPFSRIDLVSCRNLLIYFGPEVQARVLPTFHYALKPEGFLFLGSAENITQHKDLFSPVHKQHRIFRRRPGHTGPLRFAAFESARGSRTLSAPAPRSHASGTSIRNVVEAQVLERYAPVHVLVDGNADVLFYSSRTAKYLEMPAGSPTRSLFTLARRDLRLELRAVLREAMETGRRAVRESIAVEMDDGRIQMAGLVAEPFREGGNGEPLYLVVISDQGPPLSPEDASAQSRATHSDASRQAERDLRETRERLQSLVEEYETALEELKSSNEELVSVNEELQSANEELEASKEELQSVNEELHTVNGELGGKVDALDRANSDLLNLFAATDVATVFLDRQLVIRSFTPAVSNVLTIRAGDVGRPITDLSSRIALDGLADDIAAVFASGESIERRAWGGTPPLNYLVRITPYIDSTPSGRGVVVTFLDVTSLVRSESRLQMLMSELQHRTRNMLGMVQAIALRTLPDGEELQRFFRRLEAISRTQSLLGKATQEQLALEDLLLQEIEPVNAGDRFSFDGPRVMLSFEAAQTFGLAIHELVTNAVKHGALHVEGGRVEVSWTVGEGDADGETTLVWREHGVPIAAPPERKGFGRELIERALAHTLHARTELHFGADGVHCTITLPNDRLRGAERP